MKQKLICIFQYQINQISTKIGKKIKANPKGFMTQVDSKYPTSSKSVR